jgi:hypothetical protein
VLEAPIGITPIQIGRFNISIMASPRDAASNTQCVWPVSIRFANEAGKQVGPETKLMLRHGESGHGDVDGAMGQPLDQYRRAQVRPVGVIGPVDDQPGVIGPPDSQPGIVSRTDVRSGKCAAVVGASLEVFDKDTGATIATIDQFVLVPVDRAEPPPSPIEPGKK